MRAKMWLCGVVGTVVVLCGVFAGIGIGGAEQESVEGAFNWDLCAEIYEALAANQVQSIADLVAGYELDVVTMLPIVPPNENSPFAVGWGRFSLFDPKVFPPAFVDGLVPTPNETLGVTLYPVQISEDPITRDRVVSADGKTIATVPTPIGYDPFWFVKTAYGIDPEKDHWLAAIFDPARLVGEYNLVTDEALKIIAYRQTLAAAAAMPSLEDGGMQMMKSSSGPVTNLQFIGAERVSGTTNTCFTIAYPEDMGTSTLCVVTCTNLVVRDWSVLLYTNATTSTNIVDFVLEYAETPQFVSCFPEGWDTDGDGVSDGIEQYLADTQSDPNDPNDPPNIKGTLSYQTYSGGQTGPIYVVAVTSSGSWSTNISDMLSATGSYHIIDVPTGSYWVKAFRDTDWSGTPGAYEATGIYSTASMSVTGQHTGISITLTDPDMDSDGMGDWWEDDNFGNLYQAGSGDQDEDKLVNLLEYIAGTDPTDKDDTDGDDMTDDWEVYYGLDPADASDAAEDEDGDGFTNWEEFDNNGSPTTATDPTDPTDHPTGAVYVDDDGNDTNSGTYASPLASISTGIVNVASGERVVVLPGIYTGPGNRGLGFAGKDILVVGGSGAAQTIIDCEQEGRAFHLQDDETTNSVIRGFRIVNGVGGAYPDNLHGGAVRCVSSVSIEQCHFASNSVPGSGGAVFVSSAGAVLIRDCVFQANTVTNSLGGALTLMSGGLTTSVVERCVFVGNTSVDRGGALFAYLSSGASIEVRNCRFSENEADEGQAVYASFATDATTLSLLIESCTLAENDDGAGAVVACESCEPPLREVTVRNCILWNEATAQLDGVPTNAVTYCDIKDWAWGGTGNITNNPMFGYPEYRLSAPSPCVDAGTNQTWMVGATDLFGNDRIYNSIVDMGSFEYTP